jgi:hypothetical protein
MRAKIKWYKVSVEKPEGNRPLRRYGCRYPDNIKTDLKEVICEGVDWIELAQDRRQWQVLRRQ